jgi:hypothetical protein
MEMKRALTIVFVVVSGFLGGMTASWLFSLRGVQAQGGVETAQVQAPRPVPSKPPQPGPPAPLPATPVPTAVITVPATGVVFKTGEGRIVASLSADSRGGQLEIFDNNRQPVIKLGAGSIGGNVVIVHRHVSTAPPDSGLSVVDETGRARARLLIEGGAQGAGMLYLENVSTNRGHTLLPTTICQAQGHTVSECIR